MADKSLIEIDRIVREVLAQLAGATATPKPTDPPKPELPVGPAAASMPASDELVVGNRVVTMEDVVGRLTSARKLVVQPGALVTPAVVDELRRRNVMLVRGSKSPTKMQTLTRLVLVAARTRRDFSVLASAVKQQGFAIETSTTDCLIDATDRLAAELSKPNTLGLLWTRSTAIGLCLANRQPGLRAVLAGEVTATGTAIEGVGANVLVLDPASGSAYQQKQIVSQFVQGGVRPCPESLKERLEPEEKHCSCQH